MTTYTKYNDLENEFFGPPGSPLRVRYEAALDLATMGAAIRDYRRQHHLTQAELGARIGVGKAQLSKLERSALNVTIDTLQQVFGELGTVVKIKLELAG